jgi:hypothetical protein
MSKSRKKMKKIDKRKAIYVGDILVFGANGVLLVDMKIAFQSYIVEVSANDIHKIKRIPSSDVIRLIRHKRF